jgi:rubrerythrin
MIKHGYTLPAEGLGPDQLDPDRRMELDDEACNMNYIDALSLAIEKEREAFQMYAELLGKTQEPEFRKVLMDLAEEEMRHVLQFEREYQAVTHHKD